MTIHLPLFINGNFVKSSSNNTVEVLNPATQEILCQVPCATADEINMSVQYALRAFELWKEIDRLSEKKISPWIISYLHLLRIFGNQYAHA